MSTTTNRQAIHYPAAEDLDTRDVVSGWRGTIYLIPDADTGPRIHPWGVVGGGYADHYGRWIEVARWDAGTVGSELLDVLGDIEDALVEAATAWDAAEEPEDRDRIEDRLQDAYEAASAGVEMRYVDAAEWYAGIGNEDAQRAQMRIARQTTDDELRQILATEDAHITHGLVYLQRLRDEAPEIGA